MTVKPDLLGSTLVAAGAAVVGAIGGLVVSREASPERSPAEAADEQGSAAH